MPDDKNTNPSPDLNQDSAANDLPSSTLDTTATPSPVLPSEQEPETSTLAPQMNTQQVNPGQNTQQSQMATPAASQGGSGKSNNKKKWIIGGIIAGLIALLFGSGVVAYAVYQNPDKVISDGLVNLFNNQPRSFKGSVAAENDLVKLNLTLDMKGNDKAARGTLTANVNLKEQKLAFDTTADVAGTVNGDGYIKLNDIDTLVDKVTDTIVRAQAEQYKQFGMTMTESEIKAQKKQMTDQFNPVIAKINNRWIKFGADDSGEFSKQQKCIAEAFSKFEKDPAMRKELSDVYANNKFVKVKEQLGVKDGSYGYVLDLDKEKLKSFGKNAENTSLVKELKKCGDGSDASMYDTTSDESVKNMHVELWVSQWSHQITKLKIHGTDTSSKDSSGNTDVMFELTLGYDKADNITMPNDAIDFKDLQKEIEGLTPTDGTTPTADSAISI